jgi:hypothetical protein
MLYAGVIIMLAADTLSNSGAARRTNTIHKYTPTCLGYLNSKNFLGKKMYRDTAPALGSTKVIRTINRAHTHYAIIATHYYKIHIIIIVTGMCMCVYVYLYGCIRAGYCSQMSQGATGLYGLLFIFIFLNNIIRFRINIKYKPAYKFNNNNMVTCE